MEDQRKTTIKEDHRSLWKTKGRPPLTKTAAHYGRPKEDQRKTTTKEDRRSLRKTKGRPKKDHH
jgi:hypothetical protein